MKPRKRTLARQIASQLLYQFDIRRKIDKGAVSRAEAAPRGEAAPRAEAAAGGGSAPADRERPLSDADIEAFITSQNDDPDVREFARKLYHGAVESLGSTDQLLSEVVDNWKLDRIAAMDRAILRLAIFELNEMIDVPPKVVVNEAIELAKTFSTAQSGAFVNGILNRLLILRNPPPMSSHV